jgi:hypothetical protein
VSDTPVEPSSGRSYQQAVDDAVAFLRRLGAAGSPATVLVALLAPTEAPVAEPDAGVEQVLRARLEPLIRSTDLLRLVGPGEFLLVVPAGADAAGAALVDRVRGVAALPFDADEGTLSLVVQVGVSSFDADREEPSVAVDAARSDARGGR